MKRVLFLDEKSRDFETVIFDGDFHFDSVLSAEQAWGLGLVDEIFEHPERRKG